MEVRDQSDTEETSWFRRPGTLGLTAIVVALGMYSIFLFI